MMSHPQLATGFLRENRESRRALIFNMVGSLKPGVTLAQAEAKLKTVADQLAREYPDDNGGRSVTLLPLPQATINPGFRENVVSAAGLLLTVVGLVLLLFGRKGERKPVSSGWNAKTLNGFAWAVDDRTLWVSGAWNNQPPGISAVTLDGGVRPVVRIPGDLNLLDVGPGGRALVSREDFRTEVKALPPGGSTEVSLSWSDSVQPKGLSADGRQLLYGDDSGAWLGPTDGSPPVYLGKHRPLALSSDGQLALLKSSSGELLVVPTAAGEERKVALSGLDLGPNATWLTSERVAVTVKAEPLFKVRVVGSELS